MKQAKAKASLPVEDPIFEAIRTVRGLSGSELHRIGGSLAMRKSGSIRRWQTLWRTLSVPDQSHLKPLRKLTDKMLDRFESETGFRLPYSYRSFIKVFGPGVLAWDYRLFAPGYAEQGDSADLMIFNAQIKATLAKKQGFGQLTDPTQARRVIYFCGVGGGNLLGWDPADIRDRRWHEYGIYEWGREVALKYVAASFTEFIDDVCFSEANLRVPVGYSQDELGTRREFIPACDLSSIRATKP